MVIAIGVGLLAAVVGGLISTAPDADPFVELLIGVVFGVAFAYLVAAAGLVLHSLGLILALLAAGLGARVLAWGLAVLHVVLLLLTISFWVGVAILAWTS